MGLEVRFTIRQFWLPLGASILLMVIFFFLGALLSGGGHSLTALTVFFPYGVTWGQWLEGTRWEFVAQASLLLQFPLYAILMAWSRGSDRKVIFVILLAAHLLMAFIGVGVEGSRQKKFCSIKEVEPRVECTGLAALHLAASPANNGMQRTRNTAASLSSAVSARR